MSNFYVTFGTKYATKDHPRFPQAHPKGFVVIEAETEPRARDIAFEELGQYWAFLYTEEEWQQFKGDFIAGELARFKDIERKNDEGHSSSDVPQEAR